MENKNVDQYKGYKRAGEKLEIESKQIVKDTKAENLKEIEQNKQRRKFMEQMILEEEKIKIDDHTRRHIQSRERQHAAKRSKQNSYAATLMQ